MIKLSEVQLKICSIVKSICIFSTVYKNAGWIKGLINEIRLIKCPDIFFVIYNSGI